jgi:epoxide hydrolase 4
LRRCCAQALGGTLAFLSLVLCSIILFPTSWFDFGAGDPLLGRDGSKSTGTGEFVVNCTYDETVMIPVRKPAEAPPRDWLWLTVAIMSPSIEISALAERENTSRVRALRSLGDKLQPVLWLHGFPEAGGASAWRPQLSHFCSFTGGEGGEDGSGAGESGQRPDALRDEGGREFLHVVPDQLGYGLSRPAETVAEYQIEFLTQDVFSVLEELHLTPADGYPPAIVVGHDWGAAIAWSVAAARPERVARLAIINGPRAEIHARQNIANMRQLAASWYIYFFQLPWLPEFALRARDCEALHWLHRGHTTPATMAAATDLWSRPGRVEAMINWYRASFRSFFPTLAAGKLFDPISVIDVDAMILWGLNDRCLLVEGRDQSLATVSSLRRRHIHEFPGAGHWAHYDAREKVNKLLKAFLRNDDAWHR